MQEELKDSEMNAILPEETVAWIKVKLGALGYPEIIDGRKSVVNGERLRYLAFIYLHDDIVAHERARDQPNLAELEKPLDGRRLRPRDAAAEGQCAADVADDLADLEGKGDWQLV
ncbi:hypothetical protein LTR95_018939 [Oleoguttula sp. CCFEE 5521]